MGLAKIVLSVLIVSGFQLNFITSADDLLKNVKIRCYPNGGLDTRYNEYDVEEASELNLDASKSTVVYVHGWNENVNNSETLPKIVNSFLQRNEHNVCVLDFKDLAESYYKIMVDNIPQLSARMAFVLKNWIENGLNPNLIHLIGYSIGAHVCGLIGRLLLNVGYVIGRITGLDPANLLYCTSGDTPHRNALKKGDAKFVDVIHTDCGWAGCMFPLGDADFYPNKGTRNQPMCENSSVKGLVDDILDACSHHAAVVYFADSVLADSPMYLATNRQNEELTAPMGYHCPANAMGSYDLVTN